MSITIPTGFYTRPKAAKFFNRSQRSLERDLDIAYLAEDLDVLRNYKLVTKDNELRDATDVTTEQVEKLVQEGMTPIWIVEGSYLERQFGRKGLPRPRRTSEVDDPVSANRANGVPAVDAQPLTPAISRDQTEPRSALPSDLELLKRYVSRLEDENQREKERHDRIVAKLFDQLDVKDKQISAWDEITQNIYKGLATGKLQPNFRADDSNHKFLDAASTSQSSDNIQVIADADLVDEQTRTTSTAKTNKVSNSTKSAPSKPKAVSKQTASAKPDKKSVQVQKRKSPRKNNPPAKQDRTLAKKKTTKKQTIWSTPITQLFTRNR